MTLSDQGGISPSHGANGASRRGALHRLGRGVLLASIVSLFAAGWALAQPPVAPTYIPEGVWLLEEKAAVEIFDCNGLMCGKILWLKIPRDPQGELVLDKKNPDPALRRRPLCGLIMIGNLRPDGPGRWTGGWLYNPDEGKTYKVTARLVSSDVITARAYVLLPLLGKTLTLARVPHGRTEGWC